MTADDIQRDPASANEIPRDGGVPPAPPPRAWKDRYVHRFYRSRPGWVDGTVEFFNFIRRNATPASTASTASTAQPATVDNSQPSPPTRVLELGPGPQSPTTRFLVSTFGPVDGLDVDPDIRNNPDLRERTVYDGRLWPLPDRSYDLIVSDFVLEHVEDPATTFREAARVLAPGGVFCFRTPNLFHYVTLGSLLTPHWFHVWAGRRLKGHAAGSHAEYPTFYRANSAAAVRRHARSAALEEVELLRVEKEPSYASVSRVLFLTFTAYERVVNSTPLLAWARIGLFGAYRRPRE